MSSQRDDGAVDDRGAELLERGRERYGVPAAESVAEVLRLLEEFGAKPVEFERYGESLSDEFVALGLVVAAVTIADPLLLQQRATFEESEVFTSDPDEVFDPLEYGPGMVEWTTWAHEMGTLKRLIVLIERHPTDATRVGGFRVHGAGQWLRESLWAATGVVPRDPGAPSEESDLFGDAFALEGRERFSAAPIRA